ncbi:hypothetical protein [Nocardia sp. bgisy134]|uniref:hypothetical protein n=1 Tax=Nocardia sp. bgisy134 TaxID=3413789 RepID=UPI003D73DB02
MEEFLVSLFVDGQVFTASLHQSQKPHHAIRAFSSVMIVIFDNASSPGCSV